MPSYYDHITPNDGYKIKLYSNKDKYIDSPFREMQRLHAQGYTHVANMPHTNFNDVLEFGRMFGIVVRDHRVTRYVAHKK